MQSLQLVTPSRERSHQSPMLHWAQGGCQWKPPVEMSCLVQQVVGLERVFQSWASEDNGRMRLGLPYTPFLTCSQAASAGDLVIPSKKQCMLAQP